MGKTSYRKAREGGYKTGMELLEEKPTSDINTLDSKREDVEMFSGGDPKKLIEFGDEYMKWVKKRPESSVNAAFQLYRQAARGAIENGDMAALNAIMDRYRTIEKEVPKLDEYKGEFGRSLLESTVRRSGEYARELESVLTKTGGEVARARREGPVELRRGRLPGGAAEARERLKRKEREQSAAYAKKKRSASRKIMGGVKEEIREAFGKGARYKGEEPAPPESAARYMVETAKVMREKKTKTKELDKKMDSVFTLEDVMELADEYLKWTKDKPSDSVAKAVDLYQRAMEMAGHDQKLLSKIKARYTTLIRNASNAKEYRDEFFGGDIREAVSDAEKDSHDIDRIIRYRQSEKHLKRGQREVFMGEAGEPSREATITPEEAKARRQERYQKARAAEKEKLRERKAAIRSRNKKKTRT